MTEITHDERAAIYSIGNALCAPPIQENLNDACNRRAQLALVTVEAALTCKEHYLKDRDDLSTLTPQEAAQAVLRELKEDLDKIKRGFGK